MTENFFRSSAEGEAQSKGVVMKEWTRLGAILKLIVIFALVIGSLVGALIWLNRICG